MSAVRELFVTQLYEASFAETRGFESFRAELQEACEMVAAEDKAGQDWCRANRFDGYTSYASLNDLPRRATIFGEAKRRLDRHIAGFSRSLGFDLAGGRLVMDSLWVSVLGSAAGHSGHIHPHSVLSGVLYVSAPPGSGALRLEDPRLPLMMAAPPPLSDAPETARRFVNLEPSAGRIFVWESWLRHEVLPNAGKVKRISHSFNYAWR